MKGLMLHCGANAATLEEVLDVTTPPPTETHFPIPHGRLIDTVTNNLEEIGWTVTDSKFGLWKDGGDMFGIMGLDNGNGGQPDYQTILGLRNSHIKNFAAGLACGSSVFICDNLAISGDVVVFRKHTKHILTDLERLIFDALGKLREAKISQDVRIASYKATELRDTVVHDLIVRAVDAQIMANSYIAKVLAEYRNPTHEEFEERTAWSLMNSFTQVFKDTNPLDLGKRTTRLHGLLDMVVEATESRMLVEDLVNGRAVLPPAPLNHGAGELIALDATDATFETIN
jgi:hypothetical protein